ncbi:19827_t:CDS:2 [Gigaspora margarita]|uniref:19827_t:CDS:1 n=1 Tax=Gigaspora margarita TaxID=4874 RepID=A0ABM8W4M6_GIGMA|nr:19827_t:CDS:2 [Gigaspora margarita]
MNLIRSPLLTNANNNGDQIDSESLNKLFQSLINFIMIRRAQIAIYRAIPNSFSDINSEHILCEIESIITNTVEKNSCEDLGPLGIGAEKELMILKHLFMARKAIISYNFKDSSIFLYTAKTLLSSWREKSNKNEEPVGPFVALQNFFTGQERQAKNVKRANASPNNMQWLDKFLSNLTAKMTLYFMNILLEREKKFGGDSKTLWRKFSDDYNYHGLIVLIYEINENIPFCQDGYSCVTAQYEKPTGIDSFPCIYSFPENEKNQTPFTRSFPIHSFDKNTGCAYYFIRIDDHVIFVALFTEKHSTPDNSTSEFIMSLANKLSGIDVLINLQKFGE